MVEREVTEEGKQGRNGDVEKNGSESEGVVVMKDGGKQI